MPLALTCGVIGKVNPNDDTAPTSRPLTASEKREIAKILRDIASKSPSPTPEKRDPVGGFPFFISLTALFPSTALVFILTVISFELAAVQNLLVWVVTAIGGALLAQRFIFGHPSVLIHEWKHAVASSLAGNKAKGMEIKENSGHFKYEYTKETGHYNAFIALAPYVLPVFTFLAGLTAFALARTNHLATVAIVSIGYGVDLLLSLRDVSPHQTDLSDLRGGYTVGVAYIASCHLFLASLLATWVMHGGLGLLNLLDQAAQLFSQWYLWLHG